MITLEEFVSAASKLEKLGMEWKWTDPTNTHLHNSLGQGYLERIVLRPTKHLEPLQSSFPCLEEEAKENLEEIDKDEDLDSAAAAATPIPTLQLISWRFHICYSHSYQEPVLYFQVSDQSGTPLSFYQILEELENKEENFLFSSTPNSGTTGDRTHLKEESIPAITQEDHPVLYTPFYMLHPCQTGEIMALLTSHEQQKLSHPRQNSQQQHPSQLNRLNYLLAWLCVAGGPLGIAPSPSEYLEISNKTTALS